MKTKTNSIAEYYIFIITLCVVSLVYSSSSVEPVLTIRYLILSLALFILNSYLMKNKEQFKSCLVRNPVLLFYGIYILFSAISLTQVINFSEGIFEVCKVVLFGIFLITTILLVQRFWDKIDVLIKSIIILQLILSVIALLQFYTGLFSFIPGNERIYATMTNRNLLASALFLMLPFSLYGFLILKKAWSIWTSISLGLAGIVIIITKTRSVWAAIFVGLVLVIVLFIANKKLKLSELIPNKKIIKFVMIALISLLVGFGSNALIKSDGSTSNTSNNYVRKTEVQKKKLTSAQSMQVRLVAWKKTIQMIADKPILGVGAGNWKLTFPEYGLKKTYAERGRYHYKRPHNDFLWTASEIGIPGALAYFLFLLLPLIIGIKALSRISEKKTIRLTLCLLFGMVGYLVIAYFSFPKERIIQSVFMLLIISILLVINGKKKDHKKPFTYPFVVNLVLLFPIIVVGYLRYESEVHLKKALSTNNGRIALEEISKVNEIFYSIDPTVTPVEWYKGVMYTRAKENKEAFASFLQAEKVHPNHVYVLLNIGDVYRYYGKKEKAIEYYSKALHISPRFEDALINMSIAYYDLWDYPKAYKVLQRVNPKTSNPKYEQYIKLLKEKLHETNQDIQ